MNQNYLLSILFLLLSVTVVSQEKNATLYGKVHSDGKPLIGAIIYLENTSINEETNSKGSFSLKALPGKYTVSCSAIGFQTKKIEITLSANSTKELNLSLNPDNPISLNEVSIKGKSAIQQVKETPFNVVALDAKSFYNTTSDLAHMLNKASGVRIRETGGVGSDVAISLNGFTGRHVKVFMDGLPMEGFGSAFQLNNIPATMAERIEVYKGVVPIEFGADALGGIINIVTNQTANTSVDASYSYGSFNTHRTNINLNHTTKNGMSFQLSGVYNYSDNDYPMYARVLNLETNQLPQASQKVKHFNDQYENMSIVGRVGFVNKSWADRFFVGFTAGKVDRGIQNPNNLVTVFGERSYQSTTYQPTLSYDKRNLFTNGLSVRLNANYNYNTNLDIDKATRIYNWLGESRPQNGVGEAQGTSSLTEFANRNASASTSVSYNLNKKNSITVSDVYSNFTRKPSASLSDDELDESDKMRHVSIKNVSGLSYRYRHNEKWNATLFGKQYYTKAIGPEDVSTTNTTTVYEERTESFPAWGYGFASTYFLRNMQFKFSAEKAVRLPTEQELFGDEIFELGNLSLRPEKSYNVNLGFLVNQQLNENNTVYLDINTYYRNINDYIMRNVEQRFGTGFNTNHGKAQNLGVDTELRYYFKDKIMLGANVTYMDLRDKEKYRSATGSAISYTYNGRLPNVPYFFGNFDAAYYFHNLGRKGNTLNLGYTLNFVDEFFLRSEVLGAQEKATLPQQIYHDFIATYSIKNGMYNISFEAKDFTNVRLFDNFAMEKPGRTFNVKFRYYFMKRQPKNE